MITSVRLIILFLLLSLGGQAQIIRAQPFYVPQASSVLTPVFDLYPGAAVAYSLRKTRTAYSGNAIRVRKSSNNSEQDIGFTSNNDLDTASLKTFIGATDTGYITKWYDQIGSRDGSQSTAANQPRIIANNTITRAGTKPAIFFDGTNDFLRCDSISTTQIYSFSVIKPNTTTGTRTVYSQGTGGNPGQIFIFYNAGKQIIQWSSTATTASTTSISTNLQLFTMYKTGTSSPWSYGYFLNGTVDGSYTSTATAAALRPAAIGRFGGNNLYYLSANLCEFFYYNSDQSSNRTGIESNINSYYSIW